MSENLAAMKADTVNILSDWGEVLTVKRATLTYDGTGKAIRTWPPGVDYSGDWQPVKGSTQMVEVGMAVKSDAQVIFPVTANVQEGDRIYRADDSYMIVNYVKKYEDHLTVFLTKTEKEE